MSVTQHYSVGVFCEFFVGKVHFKTFAAQSVKALTMSKKQIKTFNYLTCNNLSRSFNLWSLFLECYPPTTKIREEVPTSFSISSFTILSQFSLKTPFKSYNFSTKKAKNSNQSNSTVFYFSKPNIYRNIYWSPLRPPYYKNLSTNFCLCAAIFLFHAMFEISLFYFVWRYGILLVALSSCSLKFQPFVHST